MVFCYRNTLAWIHCHAVTVPGQQKNVHSLLVIIYAAIDSIVSMNELSKGQYNIAHALQCLLHFNMCGIQSFKLICCMHENIGKD